MVEPTYRGGDVALFIDWENFKISLAAGNRTPNLSSLKEEVSEQGRVVVAKAYADWVTRSPEIRGASQFINDPPSLYAAGIEPVFVPTRVPSTQASSANGMRTYRVKNSVDVKMTADCIECAHSHPHIGTFVLVSGDSDFLHVVNALRAMGKRVVVIGVSWSTSRRLADQVDSMLLYDKDVDPVTPPNPRPAVLPHAVPTAALQPRREVQSDAPELPEAIRAIEEIIREERAAGSNPLLTSIKQRLMRRYPSFDEKKLGFSGFKKLMARAAEDGNIKLIHAGLVDWAIMSNEETPEGTTEEPPSGVAAKPGRRRGGRRRHSGGQFDADGGEETTDTAAEEEEDAEAVYAETPEETASIDFDAPGITVEDAVEVPHTEAPDEPEAEPENIFGSDAELIAAVQEALTSMTMPAEPEDGQTSERVSDLIVMANTLEHRQGLSHVTFNFLVAEICGALEQGLAAGNPQIAQRWNSTHSRDHVSKMLRGLSEGELFRRLTHSWRDEASGRRRQRSIFNLNRDNSLVGRMLEARLGPGASGTPPGEPGGETPPPPADPEEPPPQTELEQPAAESSQPEEQLALSEGEDADETTGQAPEPPPALPIIEDNDLAEDYDEPQPRTVRRRPFTSRLLRS